MTFFFHTRKSFLLIVNRSLQLLTSSEGPFLPLLNLSGHPSSSTMFPVLPFLLPHTSLFTPGKPRCPSESTVPSRITSEGGLAPYLYRSFSTSLDRVFCVPYPPSQSKVRSEQMKVLVRVSVGTSLLSLSDKSVV